MNKWMEALLLLLLSFPPSAAWAQVYPPLKNEFALPEISVVNESGQSVALASLLEQGTGAPTLLVPVFTKCQMTCPVLVQALQKALKNYDSVGGRPRFRVIVFTFDATDTAEDIANFRTDEKLPVSWSVVRSSDQGLIRDFFDQFSFSIMSSEGGFAHPSEIFVFNRERIWVGSLTGLKLSSADLIEALQIVEKSERHGAWVAMLRWLSHPERLAVFGATGFLASIAFLLGTAWTRRRRVSVTS